MTDRIWDEINAKPAKPCRWGAAVDGRERIIKPMLITEPTKTFTRPELLEAARQSAELAQEGE